LFCGHHQPLPGSTHDLTAARHHGVIAALADADLWAYDDLAYQDAGPNVTVPFRRRPPPAIGQPTRCQPQPCPQPSSRRTAVVTIKTGKVMAKLRCCPQRATTIIAVIRVVKPPKSSTNDVENNSI
jgi:hypothetical protein